MNITITSTQTQYLEILGNTTSLTAPSTVTCTHNAGFEFRDISEVRVSDMTFISCGRGYGWRTFHYSIRFSSVQLIEVTNCVFRENVGTAVGIVNSTALVSRNNTFSSNCRKCSGGCTWNNRCLGGGIYVERSNVTFHDNNIFHGNSASEGGGVYALESDVTFHNNNTLHGNSADNFGGGVYADHSNVTFHNNNTLHGNSATARHGRGGGVSAWHSNVTFHNNNTLHGNSATARHSRGGGVSAWHSNVTFHNNNTLHGNSAGYYGGGVYANHSDVTFHNNNTLHGNSAGYGGGVYAVDSDVTFCNNNTLHGNSAKFSGGGVYANSCDLTIRNNNILHGNSAKFYGGGVYAYSRDVTFHNNNTLHGNSAKLYGGGVYAWYSDVTFRNNNILQGNSARYGGGGVYALQYSHVRFSGTGTFRDNTAHDGGGIFSRDSTINVSGNSDITVRNNMAQQDGGGIYTTNSNIDISGSTTVRNNMAQQDGGGIFLSQRSTINISNTSDITVDNNKAKRNGGGIYTTDSTIDISGSTKVQNNKAQQDGGGMFLSRRSTINISNTSDITVRNNKAERAGGGIYTTDSTIDISGSTKVQNNKAQQDGGGMFLSRRSTINISNTSDITVRNNKAERAGGGIYTTDSTIDISGNTKVQNNKAQQDGGGIYLSRTHLIFAGFSKFTTNSAWQGGGIYAAASSTVDLNGINTFIANRADISGGGIWVDNGALIVDGSSYFEKCTARYDGGGIFTSAATVTLSGNNTFLSNLATLRGGGISARWSNFSFTNSSKFSNNTAETGGAIFTDNSNLDFGGLNFIESNSADIGGGIYMRNSSFHFLGNSSFILNRATRDGGGIYAIENGIIYLSGSNSFQGNTAEERGGGIFMKDSRLTSWTRNTSTSNATTEVVQRVMNLPRYSEFCRNTAMTGGGLYSIDSSLEFPETYTLNFTANVATDTGGGFATIGSTVNITGSVDFEANSAMSGGGMYAESTKVNLSGRNYFNQNHAHHEGGAVYTRASKVNLSGADRFVSNSAAMRGGSISAICTNLCFSGTTAVHRSTSQQGGAIHVVASSIIFECATELQNNAAQYGGAIFLENSTAGFGKPSCREYLGSHVTPEPGSSFINNTAALRGGAMHLDHHSSIRFHPSASALFNYNNATEYGGAIFVVDTVGRNTCPPVMRLPSRNECFYHLITNEMSQTRRINLTFEGNTAGKSGSVLYGGMLNKCYYSYSEDYTDTVDLFNRSIIHETYTGETAAISSDPRMCFCSEGGSPQCEHKVQNEDRFPGQKLNVSMMAIDQTNTPVHTHIHSDLISAEKHNSRVCESFSEEREGFCTNRSYTITSPRTTSELLLYPTTASGNPIPAVLNVTFQDCPIGFEQSNSTYECICDHRLQRFTNTCDIETQTLLRTGRLNGTFWVNASFSNETLDGYIHHTQCPLNYCTRQQSFINLNNPDEQCDFSHAGLLCGKCKENFSLILGSFRCEECSSKYLALLIPFALAGVALVILLFLLKLTVATGTLHGLIFYANIVAANHHIFFPPDTHILATIFISWLNLDLGIETCFYNGMDAYSKSWLQIVFPLYIWGIVGFLIYISKRSQRVTRQLGTNPVAALDTLFLLSYTKLLHTIITALSLTTLHYPQRDSIVWLYDASVPLPKLIPFFIAALIFLVFLFLPYTLLLLLGQWVWTKSDSKLVKSCSGKCPRLKLGLKAILDPYHAPYKPEHCYWTGLLLLLRCLLLLVSAFNISGEKDSVNLLAILLTVGVALAVLVLSGRVYKSWYLNALELSFLLNLGMLTAATYHVRLVSGDQATLAYISVVVAFLTFVGIITYHINLRMKWKLQHLPRCFRMIRKNRGGENKIVNDNPNAQNLQQENRPRAPTTTVVDLRSPLDLIDADRDEIDK